MISTSEKSMIFLSFFFNFDIFFQVAFGGVKNDPRKMVFMLKIDFYDFRGPFQIKGSTILAADRPKKLQREPLISNKSNCSEAQKVLENIVV